MTRSLGERGLFITFEGGEGSGKTTQIERAASFLRGHGREVVTTREPGGSPGADAIRRIILSGRAREFGPDVEPVLFSAARADHIQQFIRPAIEEGRDVLCDRFHDSTRVYQGLGEDAEREFLSRLERATLQGLYPDLTFVLDLPAALGLQRAAARRGADEADRFESEGVELHEARRQAFLRIARSEPERCEVIDAARSVDEVAASIEAALRERIGLGEIGR
ncbi:dTMP kinase [Aureimonas populi]|uniref:Thymidylate kinase n=1 Tax=Aureimonas populi TaxID=1701758 RepID=A0ABW5CMA9_9HYPH|nr:dTMP kinase [Aureimonas populi]